MSKPAPVNNRPTGRPDNRTAPLRGTPGRLPTLSTLPAPPLRTDATQNQPYVPPHRRGDASEQGRMNQRLIGTSQPTAGQSEQKEREDKPRWRGNNNNGNGYRREQGRPGNGGYWMAWVEDPPSSQFDDTPPDGFEGPPQDLYAADEQAMDAPPATGSHEQEATNSLQ